MVAAVDPVAGAVVVGGEPPVRGVEPPPPEPSLSPPSRIFFTPSDWGLEGTGTGWLKGVLGFLLGAHRVVEVEAEEGG